MGFSAGLSLSSSGYSMDEVVSSLQKCIRRGMEEESMYWALEMIDSGYGNWMWKRLVIMSFEDIGWKNPDVIALVIAGYQATKAFAKSMKEPDPTIVGPCVLAMCRAKNKSREGDDLAWWIGEQRRRGLKLNVPDFAKDEHTGSGRRMGRKTDFWFEEASKLISDGEEVPWNKYAKLVKEMLDEAPYAVGDQAEMF